MIILIIGLATLATFGSWMLLSSKALRYGLGLLSLLVLAGSVYLLTDHFVNHTGMTVENRVVTQKIYTAGDSKLPYGVLVYKDLGSKASSKVLVYRAGKEDKDAKAHFIPDTKHATEAVKKTATYQLADVKEAQVKTTTKRYVWKSKTAKLLYGFGGESGELVSQKSVVQVPKKTWLVLSQDQAKKLAGLAKQLQGQMAADSAKAQAMQALAKSNPEAYAEMQVSAIKKALKIKD